METPENIAAPNDGVAREKWILDKTRSPRELLQIIADTTSSSVLTKDANLAAHALRVRLSEIAEISARRLVGLTWGIVFLTVALFGIAFAQTRIMLKENAAANAEHIKASQQQQTIRTNK